MRSLQLREPVPTGLLVCGALAVAFVAFAGLQPVHDSWGWLVWGREVWDLGLDTSSGPSWKPLPVVVTTLVAPLGDFAPRMWLAAVAFSWLASAFLAWALVRDLTRGAGRWSHVGAVLAGLGVLLLYDARTPWIRQMTGGLSEPVLAAAALGATLAALRGRHPLALGLGGIACLIRPEAWPFVALYAISRIRAGELRLGIAAAGGALIACAWFVPDLVASGDALTGAERARAADTGAGASLEAMGRALTLAPASATVAVFGFIFVRELREKREIVVLGVGTAALVVLICAMSLVGFAGLARFFIPAAAAVCVLAGATIALLGGRIDRRERAPGALALTLMILLGGIVISTVQLPGQIDETRSRSDSTADLVSLAGSNAVREALACRPLTVADTLNRPAFAWALGVPISGIAASPETPPDRGLFLTPAEPTSASAPIATSGGWRAYLISASTC